MNAIQALSQLSYIPVAESFMPEWPDIVKKKNASFREYPLLPREKGKFPLFLRLGTAPPEDYFFARQLDTRRAKDSYRGRKAASPNPPGEGAAKAKMSTA